MLTLSSHPSEIDGKNQESVEKATVMLSRTADKAQKKLDKPLRVLIRDAVMKLMFYPAKQGERLTSPLSNVYSHHVKYQGKEYRIAYQINPDTESVLILLIGPHENFYKKLKNMLYAS
jgi:mRNA interferase RelE/StbE